MAGRLPPPLRQHKDDNCALACLCSLLVFHGFDVTEEALEPLAHKQAWGVGIEDLAKAAEHFSFDVTIQRLDRDTIGRLVGTGTFPILYVNRVHFDRRFPLARRLALRDVIPHAVIPVAVSAQFVTFNDPLAGTKRRVSWKKFTAAQADLGQWGVVRVKRDTPSELT